MEKFILKIRNKFNSRLIFEQNERDGVKYEEDFD